MASKSRSLDLDASGMVNELDRVTAALLRAQKAQGQVVSQTIKFDAAGNSIIDVVLELANGTQRLTAELRSQVDEVTKVRGAYTLYSHTLKEVQNAQTAAANATAAAQAKTLKSQQIVQQFVRTLPKPGPGKTPIETAAYQAQINALLKLVHTHDVSFKQLEAIWKKFQRGTTDTKGYDGALKEVHATLVRLSKAQQNLGAETKKAAATTKAQADALQKVTDAENKRAAAKARGSIAANRIEGALGPQVEGATLISKQQFHNELNRLTQLKAIYSVTTKQIDDLWRELAAGNINRYEGELGQIQAQIIKIMRAHGRNAIAEDAAAKKSLALAAKRKKQLLEQQKQLKDIHLSWLSIVRLLAVQLAHSAVARLTNAIHDGLSASIELEGSIREITTIAQGVNSRPFDTWASDIRNLSNEYARAQGDVAEGFYQALSNQITDGAETVAFMNEALRFSLAAVSTTESAVNLLTAALNGFQLSAIDAADTSALLFKTIELGRVRAEDMANSLGRIGPLANQLNITLPELAASISSMTIQGLKFNNTSTLLRAVMLKLIKPTETMQSLFEEWGVESGEAAVATFGIVGVLNKLQEASRGSASELGKIFSRLRAIQGAQLLLTSATKDFNKDLNELMTQAVPSYLEAVERATGSAGFTIEQALTRLRNIFITDVGFSLTRTITGHAESLDELEKQMLKVSSTIVILIAGFSAFKIASIAAEFALIRLNTLKKATVAGFLEVAFSAKGAAIALGIVAATYVTIKARALAMSVENRRAFRSMVVDSQEAFTEFVSQTNTFVGRSGRLWTQYWKDVRATSLAGIAEVKAALNKATAGLSDGLETGIEDLQKLGAKGIEGIEKTAAAFEKSTQKAVDRIRQLEEDGFKASVDRTTRLRDLLAKNASPTALASFDQKALRQLTNQRKILESKLARNFQLVQSEDVTASQVEQATREVERDRKRLETVQDKIGSIKEGVLDRRFEAEKEIEKLTKKSEELQRKIAEAEPDKRKNLQRRFQEIEESLSKQELILKSTGGIQKSLIRDENRKLAIAQAEEKVLRSVGHAHEILANKSKLRAAAAKEALSDLLRQDFTREGIDSSNIGAILDERIRRITELFGNEAPAGFLQELERFRLSQLALQDQRSAEVLEERLLAIAKEKLAIKQDEFDVAKRTIEILEKSAANSQSALQTNLTNIENFDPADIQKSLKQLNRLVGAGIFSGARGDFSGGDVREYLQALTELRQSLTTDKTPENLARVNDAYANFTEQSKKVLKAYQVVVDTPTVANDKALLEAKQQQAIARELFEAANEFERAVDIQVKISQGVDLVAELNKQLGELTPKAINNAAERMHDLSLETDEASDEFERLTKNVEKYSAALKKIPPIDPLTSAGGEGFAHGGRKGRDTIPSMLSPGEFVINPTTARKFHSQLLAMNNGLQPRYFGSGGSTSFGDINVNVGGGGATSGVVARDIGVALRREISRGSFRF